MYTHFISSFDRGKAYYSTIRRTLLKILIIANTLIYSLMGKNASKRDQDNRNPVHTVLGDPRVPILFHFWYLVNFH